MPIGSVEVTLPDGSGRMFYLGSYNPVDSYSQIISQACVELACEMIKRMPLDEIRAHIRKTHPEYSGLLSHVEAGKDIPIEYREKDWPVTPGAESQEIPIITELKKS